MKWGRPLRRRPFDRERGAMKIPKMLLAAMILAVTGNVRAHDWYPKECCGGHDCAPAKANPGYASARPAAADDAAVGDDDHHQARHGHRTERLQGARVEGWPRSCVYHQDGLRAGPPDVPLAAAKHLMDGFQQGRSSMLANTNCRRHVRPLRRDKRRFDAILQGICCRTLGLGTRFLEGNQLELEF